MDSPSIVGLKRKHDPMTESPAQQENKEPMWNSILECPVCYENITPPIYQCKEGHLVCNDCRKSCRKCPTCRGPLGNIRNRALEQCVANVKVSCKFKELGCHCKILLSKANNHAENCLYRPYKCPRSRSNCKWEGQLHEVVDHLLTRHNMNVTEETQIGNEPLIINETYSNPDGIKNAVWEGPIVKVNKLKDSDEETVDENFIIHFEQKPNGQYVSFVRYIGSHQNANKYRYKICCTRHGRKLEWTGIPKSIRSSAKDIMSVSDCLVIEKNMYVFKIEFKNNFVRKLVPNKTFKKKYFS